MLDIDNSTSYTPCCERVELNLDLSLNFSCVHMWLRDVSDVAITRATMVKKAPKFNPVREIVRHQHVGAKMVSLHVASGSMTFLRKHMALEHMVIDVGHVVDPKPRSAHFGLHPEICNAMEQHLVEEASRNTLAVIKNYFASSFAPCVLFQGKNGRRGPIACCHLVARLAFESGLEYQITYLQAPTWSEHKCLDGRCRECKPREPSEELWQAWHQIPTARLRGQVPPPV